MVVTVVGGIAPSEAVGLAEAMPAPADPDAIDRAMDACEWVAQGFGFP
jgi:hypothetical protein